MRERRTSESAPSGIQPRSSYGTDPVTAFEDGSVDGLLEPRFMVAVA